MTRAPESSLRFRRWLIATGCALAFAPAALAGIAERLGDAPVVAAPMRPIDDSFPGSAWFYAADDLAAPAPGVTGTAPLPALPVSELPAASGPSAVIAAKPFIFRGGPADHARALECLTAAIYYEAASESDEGQRAVAQVVLNRVRHPAFPTSVCGVIYQGSERATGCQFSYSCDGSMARRPSTSGWARARRHAAGALAGDVFASAGLATHYHTFAVTPRWNRALVMTTAIGAHFFHRWKGYWGTAAGFTQAHGGYEPAPGPKPRAGLPFAAQFTGPTRAASTSAPPRARIQPAYARSGEPVGGAPEQGDESQIQEKYRDSGEWIAR